MEAGTEADRRRELARANDLGRPGIVPHTVAVRMDGERKPLPGAALLIGEDGGEVEVRDELPGDLPLGWYRLHTRDGQQATLVAAPAQVPSTPPTWGWMLQLYALRSAESWGIGDLGDLREFIRWTAAEHQAGAVLLNPLGAPGPTHPVQPSPYTPSSRRFANPLALRIEDLDAYRRADNSTRAEVDALRVSSSTAADRPRLGVGGQTLSAGITLAQRGPALSAGGAHALRGLTGLGHLLRAGRTAWRPVVSLAEALRVVDGPAVTAARRELAPRIAFHAWVQQRCVEQLTGVRTTARDLGMALGVLHDLPVGVDADGADAWALAGVLATGVSVGAPPDNFTPRGQDWGLPPWRPDRLAATGYAPFRDMLRAVLGYADGLRIDHVAGLWRLWWIPPGDGPDRGTYVYYDADAMLAVLALEAHRAGSVVVGEDLGTVEPEVTEEPCQPRNAGLRGVLVYP